MMRLQLHSRTTRKKLGSTWAGATHPAGLPLTAAAALVAPAHVPRSPESVPKLDQSKYLIQTKGGTPAGRSEYMIMTRVGTKSGRDCGH
jgi:hypothetical protein